jgi:uncharacterized repeat protein (TIGR01451 family)
MPKHQQMSRRVFKWLIVLAAGLGVTSVLLFYFGSSSFTESKVLLTLEGPTQSSVGDEVVYKVHYENKTKTALHHVKLAFTYPDTSVIVQDGKIINNPGNVQGIDQEDLAPGASRDQEFHSFLVGDKGNIKLARVKLSFDAGNIKTPFEKNAQLSTTISEVPIALTFVGPPTSVSGQAVTYLLDYRNQSSEDISGLQLVVAYPDGFTPGKISPIPSSGNATWNLSTLKKGAGARITIQGTLSGREGDSKQVTASLKRNIDDTLVDYEKTNVTTVISSPLLSVDTSVNGSSDYISHAGDTLQYSIRYSNTSNVTLTGLVLTAKLEGSMYDVATIDTKGGYYDASARTISWNSTVIPAFNSLQPRANGTANFSIKLKSSISGGGSNSLFTHATITLLTENVPDTIDANSIVVTDDVVTKITSQPTFRQTMYYNDSAFGSAGVMPPQAGKDTTYTIHWQIVNPGSALNNAKITATVPQGVTWKNVISVGNGQPQPTYNKNTSQISWPIGTLPSGVGVDGSLPYELAFQVTVRPSPTQVGQPASVLTSPALSGVDSSTKQNIIVNAQDLTTNSTVDQPNQGTVQ